MSVALTTEQRLLLQQGLAVLEKEISKRQERQQHLKRIADDADAVRSECLPLNGFIKNSWHIYEPGVRYISNWHVDAICDHLEGVHRGDITRFLCNMPPGMMKSTTIGVGFPAWEWGPKKSPWLRYFTTSYEAGYARRDSRKHRDLVLSEWYQSLWPDVTLTKTGEDEFENTYKGGRKAVPFKRLTAGRGNRLIIDDPHSTEGAESPQQRETTTRLFRESAQSRLNDQERDAIIVVMQRLNPDDLSGVIEELGLPYVKLVLPMEYVRSLTVKTPWFTDPRTEDGELLHPKFMGREKVEAQKVASGSYAWDTQYQQQARSRDGSTFFSQSSLLVDMGPSVGFKPVSQPKVCDAVYMVADTASKVGKHRDGTGCSYWALTLYPKVKLEILDWDVTQIQANTLKVWLPGALKLGEKYAIECGARGGFIGCHIEDKDSGIVLLQDARASGLPAFPIPSEFTALGKEGRAVSVSGYVNQGLVKLTEKAFNKVTLYKGKSRNHFVTQVTSFRVGHGTPDDEDELFDNFCYGVHLGLGDASQGKGKT